MLVYLNCCSTVNAPVGMGYGFGLLVFAIAAAIIEAGKLAPGNLMPITEVKVLEAEKKENKISEIQTESCGIADAITEQQKMLYLALLIFVSVVIVLLAVALMP